MCTNHFKDSFVYLVVSDSEIIRGMRRREREIQLRYTVVHKYQVFTGKL